VIVAVIEVHTTTSSPAVVVTVTGQLVPVGHAARQTVFTGQTPVHAALISRTAERQRFAEEIVALVLLHDEIPPFVSEQIEAPELFERIVIPVGTPFVSSVVPLVCPTQPMAQEVPSATPIVIAL
jgi:hypothetical protein